MIANLFIAKPWNPDMDVEKEELKSIPIWIQLKIGFKTGEKSPCLRLWIKLVSHCSVTMLLGSVIRCNMLGSQLIEVQLAQAFINQIYFVNEHGSRTQVDVHYEWKPIERKSCHLLGHDTADCKRVY